jgi:hypothetical protein
LPTVVCPVCGTDNDSSRVFCRKCASDLHATIVMTNAGPAIAPPPAPAQVPIRPIVIGGGIALLLVILVLGAVLALGGSPAASPTAAAPTATDVTPPSAGPTLSPTRTPEPAPTATPLPPTAAPPATPAPTPTDAPPIIRSFTGPASVDCSDPSFSGFIHLAWRIGNADGAQLSIDGPGIYKTYDGVLREDDVPFGCDGSSHTYILVTYGGIDPPAEKDLVIGPTTP